MEKESPESQRETASVTSDRVGDGQAGLSALREKRASLRVQIAAAVFSELNAMEIEFVAISGYASYPDAIVSDLDLVIRRSDQQRLLVAMKRAAARCGARIIARLSFHNGQTYVITLLRNGVAATLWCDTATKFHQAGRLWLRSEDILRDRRMDQRGFYIAAPISRFHYHLIKKINKEKISSRQANELSIVYQECSAAADALLERMFSRQIAALLKEALICDQWDAIRANFPLIRRELRDHSALDGPASQAYYYLWGAAHKLRRGFTRTGISVAILGPEDCGKSRVIEQYLSALGWYTASLHLYPRLITDSAAAQSANVGSHNPTTRGELASSAKLLFLWAGYLLSYWLRVRPLLMRHTLVVFDRYCYDLLIGARRFRYGGPQWLARLVAALTPKPDLILFLDAPADLLLAEKQKVSTGEFARQAEAYRTVANSAALRGRAVLVDMARPLEQVVQQCADRTLAFLELRAARRLHLD